MEAQIDRRTKVELELCARIAKVRRYHKHVAELHEDRGRAIIMGCEYVQGEYANCIRDMKDHIAAENELIGRLAVEYSIIVECDTRMDLEKGGR